MEVKVERDESGILIEWGDEVFALWCLRCGRVSQFYKSESENELCIRCTACNYKVAEKVSVEDVEVYREAEGMVFH